MISKSSAEGENLEPDISFGLTVTWNFMIVKAKPKFGYEAQSLKIRPIFIPSFVIRLLSH